ncbi:NADH dehydrogenase subunit 1 (mitochondrion) [Sporothrix brasiliensis 5110]|uniref:NADH-ubiquinone oxidoreductase chain 1 n=1 Tax=Sporothrix brasiliensis 5110 TaxID=1398154 RepID=A0A0C2F5E4_9PEZI|nr:NADH dehydrogenase subunit 1 [Sporothrix brasiliensis 5110]KIH86263.1 NADH dehydrogenase subunit 1 [Sporothrix brasiliensis 5110]
MNNSESELVSGFMTEHAAVVFVFFFLAEYGSIVLMCILTSILFIGGYLFIGSSLINLTLYLSGTNFIINNIINSPILEGLLYGLSLGIKSSMMVFVFIWVRASFPRIRFDQLMGFCWTVLLPIIFAIIILIPAILYNFVLFPINISLL